MLEVLISRFVWSQVRKKLLEWKTKWWKGTISESKFILFLIFGCSVTVCCFFQVRGYWQISWRFSLHDENDICVSRAGRYRHLYLRYACARIRFSVPGTKQTSCLPFLLRLGKLLPAQRMPYRRISHSSVGIPGVHKTTRVRKWNNSYCLSYRFELRD